MSANRTSLLRDARGAAIYVELLLVVPLIAILWMAASYVHRLGASEVAVQRRARACAWIEASTGCRGAVAGCELEGPGRVDAPELDRVAGSGLGEVVRPIARLASLFRAPAGDEIAARAHDQVSRLSFGGSAATSGMQRMMCNAAPRAPRVPEVMDLTCKGLLGPLGAGGRCP